jgi:hypothetical protein
MNSMKPVRRGSIVERISGRADLSGVRFRELMVYWLAFVVSLVKDSVRTSNIDVHRLFLARLRLSSDILDAGRRRGRMLLGFQLLGRQ